MKRLNISSGSPWEPLRGYSRAVQVGNTLYVSGTTAMTQGGEVIGAGDAYAQTRYVLDSIKMILHRGGFQLDDVVRTRLFVTQLAQWDDYAKAHREIFGEIRPASSIVQISRLVDPRLLVEIEVEAIKGVTGVEQIAL